jgi:hypothetical protein
MNRWLAVALLEAAGCELSLKRFCAFFPTTLEATVFWTVISSSSDIGSLMMSSTGKGTSDFLMPFGTPSVLTRWACFENKVRRSALRPFSSNSFL